MQRFWATDGNRKCAVFVFNLSSHYHIYIVKYLFTSRDDYFENLRNTTVLAYEMFTSGCRPWLKNVACLSSLFSALRYRSDIMQVTKFGYQTSWWESNYHRKKMANFIYGGNRAVFKWLSIVIPWLRMLSDWLKRLSPSFSTNETQNQNQSHHVRVIFFPGLWVTGNC